VTGRACKRFWWWLAAAGAALALLPATEAAPAQEASSTLKTQMAQGDPVSRARSFAKYGEAMIHEARAATRENDYEKAEKLLTEYRDTVKQLLASLRATVPNPEKRPNGFKQLQIHVRKTLKDVDDIVASVPANLHPPFAFLRKEIDLLDRALIEDLFPRRPGREEKKKGL